MMSLRYYIPSSKTSPSKRTCSIHYPLFTILLFLFHYLVKTVHRLPRLPVEVVDCRYFGVDLPDDFLHISTVFHPGKSVAERGQQIGKIIAVAQETADEREPVGDGFKRKRARFGRFNLRKRSGHFFQLCRE